ncbi:flagellin [Sulfurivirga sp.]|uniref:flagellin N-terminal helical domain-containing protein n=1 Tax=Sulfurivirga sp. TaxID=2614236 RepID=UPI0025F984E8|nr:flagellin [Sulfurivirga sp.]
MAMVINTNMASENAVRLLDQVSRSQKTSMERLTSGLRINHTADDAAGKAVVTKMDSQVRGTDMAIRNVQDGIGVVQTLDGATEEVVNMLQRMRELAIQAANDTYTSAQRYDIQLEVSQLKVEISRIGQTLKYNGTTLLTGSNKGLSIHAGWEVAKANEISIPLISLAAGNANLHYPSADVTKQSAALATVSLMDNDISQLNKYRAQWGAIQNRFEHTITNLQNVNENIKASRSRILDADYARESANLARTQVLQQAGMAMLSQANQQSQQVIQLLK